MTGKEKPIEIILQNLRQMRLAVDKISQDQNEINQEILVVLIETLLSLAEIISKTIEPNAESKEILMRMFNKLFLASLSNKGAGRYEN
ncbi:hypothetical protein KJ628_05170 [Patescibacteria group bacterium]|nr:hypothetical protein [Patescibacteria group bacterium]